MGYSDHSARMETCIAATVLGAEILEIHAVFSRDSFGPDASSSLEIDEIKDLVDAVRRTELALNEPVDKSDNSNFADLKEIFEKSLAVNRDLKKGEELKFEYLEAKKPKNHGINAADFQDVIGKKLKTDIKKWSFLKPDHI